MNIDWTKHQTISQAYKVENWHDGEDSSFIWVEENGVIMCDPKYILIDFETEYELTEDEVKIRRRHRQGRYLLCGLSKN